MQYKVVRYEIIIFGDISYLFTFNCLFTLVPNSAIIADMTLLMQYKVVRYEKFINYDLLLNSPLPISPQVYRAIALLLIF